MHLVNKICIIVNTTPDLLALTRIGIIMTRTLAQHRNVVKNATASLESYRSSLKLINDGTNVGGELQIAAKIIHAKKCIDKSTSAIMRIERAMEIATPRQIEAKMCSKCFTEHNGDCL